MSIFNFFGVKKYYKMTDKELEDECNKRNIPAVGFSAGALDRITIITQLLMQDSEKNNRFTFLIVILTFIVSVIALIKSFI
ncbi:hypothetical protein ES702_02845 [subsurface metagenome]